MIESFVGLIFLLVAVAFWAFILYVLWNMLLALHNIDRSVDDVAKTLRNQKSG